MTCPDVDLFIQALEEGRVPQELDAHMEVCPVCRKMWWTLENASPRPYPEEPPSERMMQAALRGIEAGRREEERRARITRNRWPTSVGIGGPLPLERVALIPRNTQAAATSTSPPSSWTPPWWASPPPSTACVGRSSPGKATAGRRQPAPGRGGAEPRRTTA
jgi:hypothetical protein